MPRNVGIVDQVVRAMLGLACVAYAFGGDMNFYGAAPLFLIGAILFATAIFRYCPLYSFVGVSTYEPKDRSA